MTIMTTMTIKTSASRRLSLIRIMPYNLFLPAKSSHLQDSNHGNDILVRKEAEGKLEASGGIEPAFPPPSWFVSVAP